MTEPRVDWKEAGRMLVEGSTFTDIATRFGVSRQHIQQHYTRGKKGRRPSGFGKIIYPALREWAVRQGKSYRSLEAVMFPDRPKNSASGQMLRNIMIGRTKAIPIEVIYTLCNATGMTFEEMFRKEEGNQ